MAARGHVRSRSTDAAGRRGQVGVTHDGGL